MSNWKIRVLDFVMLTLGYERYEEVYKVLPLQTFESGFTNQTVV